MDAFEDKSGLQVSGPAEENPLLAQNKQESHIYSANQNLGKALRGPENNSIKQQLGQSQETGNKTKKLKNDEHEISHNRQITHQHHIIKEKAKKSAATNRDKALDLEPPKPDSPKRK